MAAAEAATSAEIVIYESEKYPGLRGMCRALLDDAEGRIQACIAWKDTTLHLDDFQLTNLPAELGQCVSLEVLNIGRNWLKTLPVELGQCTSLKKLYCSVNQLEELPAELGQCVALEELLCYVNELKALPAELGQCSRLERLCCGQNYLETLPVSLGRCASLIRLDCEENSLNPGSPSTIAELRARWEEARPHTKSAAKQ